MSCRLPPAAAVVLGATTIALSALAFAGRVDSDPQAPSAPPTPARPAQQPPAQPVQPAAPAQQPPAEHPPATQAPAAQAPAPQAPADQEAPPAEGRGRRGARGEGSGTPAGEEKKDEKPRRGLAVTDPLIVQKCGGCHFDAGGGMLSRISYLRKAPEAWELSVKRMLRLQNVQLTPDEAKRVVRYLADHHGLARAEAEKALYEAERRIHWSEEAHEQDLRSSCGECHTLGRVLSERRDPQEWKLLKATHLAFFPLAQFQAFSGPGGGFEGVDWDALSEAEAEAEWERRRSQPRQDQADKVLERLAKDLPLFTPEWEAWQANDRDVPLAGEWEVLGREPGRGEVRGTLKLTALGADEYETQWTISIAGGASFVRTGKGVLYTGYQWRGRSSTSAAGEAAELREALLLSDDWGTLQGRLFTGEYSEVGMDVRARRKTGATTLFQLEQAALAIPSEDQPVEVLGSGFPTDLTAADFHLGDGISIVAAQRIDAGRVRLTVDVDRKAERGKREISFRAVRGPADVVLYDTIDYVKVTPERGFARVGGKMRPPQTERFEAVAMNRGPDDELYTADDYAVKPVAATWSVEEFPVRENDDDAQYVGAIDPATGLFTPALDGPNPARKWSMNNIGEVYVVATVRLNVRELPPKPKPKPKPKSEGQSGDKPDEKPAGEVEPPKPAPPAAPDDEPIRIVEKEFRSRGRLIVTIPLYVDWSRYQFDRP